MELTDAEMNAIYDEFEEDYQKADLEEVLKVLAFHNASQARYARNAQVHPVARDILSHQAWKELEEKARYYVEIMGIGNTSLLNEEELQEYNDYWNSCSCCHRVFDQPYPCYQCELERWQEETRDSEEDIPPNEFL